MLPEWYFSAMSDQAIAPLPILSLHCHSNPLNSHPQIGLQSFALCESILETALETSTGPEHGSAGPHWDSTNGTYLTCAV